MYIGIISGTSMDACDVALGNFAGGRCECLAYHQYPMPDELRRSLAVTHGQALNITISRMAYLDHSLGHFFADSVNALLRAEVVDPTQVTAIGSHGQTILHQPYASPPYSMQIGDPNIIAYETGITTVADLRRMDMAAGGQGAPLASAFHVAQLRTNDQARAVLNIGGIANVTMLPTDPLAPVTGWDTGPGNALLDDWAEIHLGTTMDEDGKFAARGNADPQLLECLRDDVFFAKTPPKTTGRDYFNRNWLSAKLHQLDRQLDPADVQATLVELTVSVASDAIIARLRENGEVLVCGGGAYNPVLMSALRSALAPRRTTTTESCGIAPERVEALAFAWFAKCRLEGTPSNLPAVTGAQAGVLLGAIYAPPPAP